MVYTFSQFDGINSAIAPYKVPDNLGVNFVNIDTYSKTLKSAKGYLDTEESMEGNTYWYKAPNYDIKLPNESSIVYQNKYIYYTDKGTNDTSILKRYSITNDTTSTVGLAKPTFDVTVGETGDYYDTADFTYAYYYYAITYYDPETGEESEPLLTDVFGATKITITLTLTGVDTTKPAIRIYRVGNYITKFTLVEEIDITSANILYEDTKPDTALTLLLTTRGTITPPTGLTNLVSHQGTFYGSVGSRLRFSAPGNANSWEALSYIDMEADIIGLASVNSVLVILLRHKVLLLTGNDISNYTLLTLMSDTGCVDTSSIATFRNFIVFLTDEGLCITDGNTIQYVTRYIYDFDIDTINVKDAVVLTDRYFMLTDDYLYELDFRNDTPKFLLYDNISGINSLSAYKNKLYGCADNIVQFFVGSEDLAIKYETKDIVATNFNYEIELEKVSISFLGDFLFKIKINNDIISKNLSSNNLILEDIYVPTSTNRCLTTSFEVEGTGEIFAINFTYSIPEVEG